MSCENVVLLCAWCQKVEVGSYHCCDAVIHDQLCAACQVIVDGLTAQSLCPSPSAVPPPGEPPTS